MTLEHCVICLESTGELIVPCNCSFVHRACVDGKLEWCKTCDVGFRRDKKRFGWLASLVGTLIVLGLFVSFLSCFVWLTATGASVRPSDPEWMFWATHGCTLAYLFMLVVKAVGMAVSADSGGAFNVAFYVLSAYIHRRTWIWYFCVWRAWRNLSYLRSAVGPIHDYGVRNMAIRRFRVWARIRSAAAWMRRRIV